MKQFILLILFFIPINFIFCQENDIEDNLVDYNTEVHNINFIFKSTQSFKESDLNIVIESPKSDYLNFQTLELDLRRLDKFYFDNGFFDAQIDTNIVLLSNKKIDLNFIITENRPYSIRNIIYKGLDSLRAGTLDKLNDNTMPFLKTNDRYNKINLNNEENRIITYLNNNGYALASFKEPFVSKLMSKDTSLAYKVDITLQIEPGAFYYFGKTTVEINDNPKVYGVDDIFKSLEYNEGDVYSKTKLTDSEARIGKISILENSRILVKDVDSVNNKINLVATASLGNKYEIQPQINGYQIQNNFYAGVGLTFMDKYFFRGGRTFNLSSYFLIHASDNYIIEASMNLNQPNIFNNNKITGVWNITGQFMKDGIYNISSVNNSFSLNYELPHNTYISNLNFEWKIKNDNFTIRKLATLPYNQIDTIQLPEFKIDLFSSILGITAIHNRTDNFAYPTSGFYQSFLLEESGLLGTLVDNMFAVSIFKYVKLTNFNKFYLDFTKRKTNILAVKFLIGTIFEFGNNTLKISDYNQETNIDIIPIEARFISGGSNSVRGWNAKKLGTFPISENGGDFILEGSFEYRMKPFTEKENFFKDVGFVTFLDYGNLWLKPSKFKANEIAIAFGVGLRYYTVVGPIRFDIGIRLFDPQAPGNNTEQWLYQNDFNTILKKKIAFQFGIGNTF